MLDKLEVKSKKCLFVIYPKETIRYYFYHPLEKRVLFSKHAVFFKKDFLLREDNESKLKLRKFKLLILT